GGALPQASVVPSRGGYVRAIGAEGDVIDARRVSSQRRQFTTRSHTPNHRAAVATTSCQRRTTRAKCQCTSHKQWSRRLAKRRDWLAKRSCRKVPEPDCRILTTRGQSRPIG